MNRNKLTKREHDLLLVAFQSGYETGHHDTVESQYYDPEEVAHEWIADALEDGTITGMDNI